MTNPTRFERALALVFPRAALRRYQLRVQFTSLAYQGASRRRDSMSGWTTPATYNDEAEVLQDLPNLRARSRDLNRNNATAAGVTHTKVNSVVGTGLKLRSSIDRGILNLTDEQADDLEATFEREFGLWASSQNSDIERTLQFPEHQDLAFRSCLENGDHLIFLTGSSRPDWPFTLTLQHIESDRVSNPDRVKDTENLIAGVEKDDNGAPTAYHVLDAPAHMIHTPGAEWRRLPAFAPSGRRLVIHLFRKLTPGQTRGIPDLSPVIEPLKQLGRYSDAEVDAAVKNSLWALLVKTETGDGLAGLNYSDWRETRKEFYKEAPINLKDGSSNVLGLFPDDAVESFDPKRPVTAFDPFMQAMFAQIGVALELPQEVVTKRFQSSYSAARAALLQAYQFFNIRRSWLARYFCQPIYEAVLWESVTAGRVRAPGFLTDYRLRAAYSGAEWIGDAPGSIDEVKAVQAAVARIDGGLSTRKRETAALTGEDWDTVRRQREKEQRLTGQTENLPDEGLPNE